MRVERVEGFTAFRIHPFVVNEQLEKKIIWSIFTSRYNFFSTTFKSDQQMRTNSYSSILSSIVATERRRFT